MPLSWPALVVPELPGDEVDDDPVDGAVDEALEVGVVPGPVSPQAASPRTAASAAAPTSHRLCCFARGR
jgi:hypothetical protein